MMTDPIADMLTRIRNAARAGHPELEVPYSRIKERVAEVLVNEGFLQESKKTKSKTDSKDVLRVQVKFDKEKKPVMIGLKRVSRPGRRVYVGSEEIPLLRGGLGINILSTPKGILVDREARKAHVGGELICSAW